MSLINFKLTKCVSFVCSGNEMEGAFCGNANLMNVDFSIKVFPLIRFHIVDYKHFYIFLFKFFHL
jgi:hypothetical protein